MIKDVSLWVSTGCLGIIIIEICNCYTIEESLALIKGNIWDSGILFIGIYILKMPHILPLDLLWGKGVNR